MIKGNYSLTLTCDVCGKKDGGYSSLTVYVGQDSNAAMSKAYAAGWLVKLSPNEAVCPNCAKGEKP